MSLRIQRPSSRGQSSNNRSRLITYSVIVGALLVVWTLGVLAIGLGSGGSGPDKRGGSASAPGHHHSQGGDQQVQPPKHPKTILESDQGQKDYVTPEHPQQFAKKEQKRDRKAQGLPPVPSGGATDEPSGYDPLGIKHQKVPLTPADKSRVEGAASEFVTAAYGYSGPKGSSKEYLAGVEEAVITPGFYSSEGAAEVKRYSELVDKSGTQSAAKMSSFDILKGATKDTLEGYAYFDTADTYNRYGEIEGHKTSYRQKLTVVRYGATFKVKSAGAVQEVRKP